MSVHAWHFCWLIDRFSVSWEIMPEALIQMVDDDKQAATRARQAMYEMRKIDIAALEVAFNNP